MRQCSICIVTLALVALACTAGPTESQITREQAIEIALQEVSFEPDSIEAELFTSEEPEVWRVTFRGRLSGQPPGLSEMVIVEIDATSGEILSIART